MSRLVFVLVPIAIGLAPPVLTRAASRAAAPPNIKAVLIRMGAADKAEGPDWLKGRRQGSANPQRKDR